MQTSDRGKAFIAAHEGIVTRAYRCPAGVLTIGVGHTSAAGAPKVTPGMTISRDQALAILATDLPKYEARVVKRMGAVPQNVLDGSVSFDFNTGAITRASWVAKFLEGLAPAAEAALKLWNKGGGRVLKGLVRRRAEEADVIFRNVYAAADEAASASDRKVEIATVQEMLKTLGLYTGTIDGIAGPLTRGAVENFQRKHGLVVDGIVGPATRATLLRAIAAHRANQASVGTGGAAGAGTAGADAVNNGSIDPSAVTDINLWLVIAAGLAVALLVWGGLWLWRNRGRFTGKRIPT